MRRERKMPASRPAVAAAVLAVVFASPLDVIAGGPAAPHKHVTAWTPQDIRWFTPAYYTDGRQRAQLYGDSRVTPPHLDHAPVDASPQVP